MTLRNPIEWGSDQVVVAASAVKSAVDSIHHPDEAVRPRPVIRRIAIADLKDVLAKGFQDFAAYRTDVIFLCVLYPIVGLVMARLVFGQGLFQLLFPIASGFALVGPFVSIGLYEMSREHEQGAPVSWITAFQVLRSRSAGAIAVLGIGLAAIFLLWLYAAQAIYNATLGPELPQSIGVLVHDVAATPGGWALIGVGVGVGFVFALVVFVATIVSFPLLLDRRDIGIDVAIGTSIRAVAANPGPMAVWGLIVAAGLAVGSIPFLIGLAFVIPILGHATWHLYRKLIAPGV
jgi:uncharacterized membrane protein